MASKSNSKSRTSICQELANWYIKYYAINNSNIAFLSTFALSHMDKAYVLVVGESSLKRDNHMFYLWRFKRNWDSRDELLRRIRNNTLWLSLPATINDFEGVFNYVWRTLNNPKIPQIAQLAIYDISIRLAYLHQNKNLLPKDVVYIHALPMRAFNLLIKKNIIKGVQRDTPQVSYVQLTGFFPRLNAFQIEDLLCQLGKSLRRVNNSKSSVKTADQVIDSIVRKYRLNY